MDKVTGAVKTYGHFVFYKNTIDFFDLDILYR